MYAIRSYYALRDSAVFDSVDVRDRCEPVNGNLISCARSKESDPIETAFPVGTGHVLGSRSAREDDEDSDEEEPDEDSYNFV